MSVKDDYTLGDDDPVGLHDVAMAAHLYRTARGHDARRTHEAYRDRLIRRCYDDGNVTRAMLADAAHLSLSRIDAIRRAGELPRPRPKLRVVR